VEEPRRLDDVLADFDEWADSSDHAEFFWFPHTDIAATKTNTRIELTPDTRGRWTRVRDEEVVQNALFGTVTRLGTLRPSMIPSLARTVVKKLGRSEYTAPGHAVFTSPRRVRFKEMEYNLPRSALLEAFDRVRGLVDDLRHPVSFPIEVRVLGADDIPLSPAFERESAYIAVHVPARERHERYFDGVEEIMDDYGGRPHWGKLHGQTAATLRFRYPRWASFEAQRELIDPDRCFTNPELARVLGD
jgi:L-gulonolactone oxidase